ncbi:glycosyltransferase family 4 protein [Devosia nitrariae]|uniref:Glycosyl transferase n=1 Tax=Devosia nitrariae TaxID=2071872 RepID=A0ABQ5W1H0_9HYPH|nr:glycosyltransferase family 4 protein [Devosia nitrariae]GLQ53651.1 glycosyl transferase [Devosia nitrariae]
MKVAILSTVPATPPTAGNRSRILALSRALRALGHGVHFVYLPSTMTSEPDDDAHLAEFGRENYIRLPSSVLSSPEFLLKRLAWRVRRKLLSPLRVGGAYYLGLDECYPSRLTDMLRALQQVHGFDTVICEYISQSAALEAFPSNVLKVLDTHDSFSDRHKLVPGRTYWFSVPPSEQVRAFHRADVVLAIQEEEGDLFRRQLAGNGPAMEVVSHLLDVSRPVTDFRSSDAIFVGSDNQANLAAVQYFTQSVLPLIRERLPQFNLMLVGSICRRVSDVGGVVKLGMVDDLSAAYSRAPISVNPMLAGTGINIKLLEALAAGVPAISTQTGARGLGKNYSNGVFVIPDGDAQAFADQVVELANCPSARREKGRAAHEDALAWNDAQMHVLKRVFERA